MSYSWAKLWIEMLDDRKAASLPDSSWRRFVECILLAMETNRGGILPTVADMAWRLRVTPETMGDDLTRLALAGLVHLNEDDEWVVTNFTKRQAFIPVNDRVANHRERKKREKNPPDLPQSNDDVTPVQRDSNDDVTQSKRNGNEHVTNRYTDKIRIDKNRQDVDEIAAQPPPRPASPSRAPKPQPSMIAEAHPAVKAIYDVTTYWPAEAAHPVIIEKIGDNPDIEALGRAYQLWVSRGYNPKNFSDMLEWYRELAGNMTWNPPARHKNGKDTPTKTVSKPPPGSQPVNW